MRNLTLLSTTGALIVSGLLLLGGCSGGRAGDRANRGDFKVTLISTGLGQIFPYRIREVDQFGNPTSKVLNIENIDVLKANANANNPVLPVATFGTTATLPDGSAGNHFLLIKFSHKVRVESILSDLLANQTNSGLTTAVSLLAYNPVTESTSVIKGRGFVGGYTFYNEGGKLVKVRAVEDDGNGNVVIKDSRANGFPRGFTGDEDLVSEKSFVFVADADNDLTTFETFPSNVLLRIIISNAVQDSDGKVLEHEACVATTVGPDPNPPDVLGFSPNKTLEITPGNGQGNVDPTTTILVRFNKPVQPTDVGTFFDAANLIPATGGITISVKVAANTFNVIYYADPLGFGDLCNYRITPAYTLPGQSEVTVTANNTSIRGLALQQLGNTVSTKFTTGDGPGIVNAPVAPEAIYVGIGGSEPGVSVIDLNGFGQGTGDINNTRFPLNPNVGAPGVFPVLSPGKTNLDAGSGGALTLVKDSAGNTRLLRSPLVGQVGDIHLGCPLDLVFNNENINVNATRANQVTPLSPGTVPGNSIMVAPHPNPPRLVFPPPNPARAIFGEEPTVTSATGPPGTITTGGQPPCMQIPINLLTRGNPFSNQKTQVGIFGVSMEGVFYGPQPPPASPPPPTPYCPFTSRQQIGHFMYVLDRDNRQILVVNSNRFTVLDTIKTTDPVDMAVSPNLRVLAVTNFSSSSVTFIDINPFSTNFHKVIGETRVEAGPTEVAWQPDGEDILVISQAANALNILNGQDFNVRKTVTGFLNNPVALAVTERYQTSGYLQGVYYAYILNGNGNVAVYESGPAGVNGIGFDDIIGTVPNHSFRRGRAIVNDPTSQNGAVLIAHVDDRGLGQVSKLELTSSPTGPQPITQNQGGFIIPPTFRQKEWTVVQRFGGTDPTTPVKDLLSGNAPVDIALDEMINNGAAGDQITPFNSKILLPPMNHSGKGTVKLGQGAVSPAFNPKFIFIALGDTGKIDVMDLGSGKRVTTIDVPGVTVVASYWRQ